jgi:membrane associated rhomboid family serine protease
MSERDNFPIVTFIISLIYLAVFLFTYQNIIFYENMFGFIPASPKVWSLVTYSFIHADIIHLLGNLVIFIIVGLVIEEALGKFVYLTIYLASANIAIIFDIVGRFTFNISFRSPFIGGSGAIFGLIGVMLLIKPFEKIPSMLILLFAFPLFFIIYQAGIIPPIPIVTMTVLIGIGVVIATVFFVCPGISGIFVFALYTLFTITTIYLGAQSNVSHLGHLGGVFGGIISFLLFAKSTDDEKSFKYT